MAQPPVCGGPVGIASLTSIVEIDDDPQYTHQTMSEEPIDSNSTSTGLAPNVGAGLACLLTFITGLIFLLLEKKNDFIRYWASQALVVGVAWFAFSVIIRIASTIFSQIPARL